MARGEYGRPQDERVQQWRGAAPAGPEDDSWFPQVAWPSWSQGLAAPAATLGVGVILGIIIGSKITFHSPVRSRR